MKFKIDENLPSEVAVILQQAGHDADTIHDENLAGTVDVNIASVCQSEGRAIVTLDLDFADIRVYPPDEYHGIIVMRLKRGSKAQVLVLVRRWLQALATEPLIGHLWIVDDNKIRIRK